MHIKSLNGIWQCTLPNGNTKDVAVPGCAEQVWEDWGTAGPFDFETTFEYQGGGAARLRFGAVSYACEVFLNDERLGAHEGMWDAFVLDCGKALRQGENRLRVRVVKPGYQAGDAYPLRAVLSGFLPDVLTTFAGPWDSVSLLTARNLFVYAHHGAGDCASSGRVMAEVEALEACEARLSLTVSGPGLEEEVRADSVVRLQPGRQQVSVVFQVPGAVPWSPANPALYHYRLVIALPGDDLTAEGRLGFRSFTAQGKQLLLNGQPFYLRGILHWGYDDETILPNADENAIRRELLLMKAHGFNAVKHCLYIPRQRYFELMDELGLMAWVELPLWLPEASPGLEERIRREYPRILDSLKGHPSLALLSLGCELDESVQPGLLEEMYELARQETGIPVRDNSGSGECYGGLAVDFADYYDYHFYAELPHLEQLVEHFTPAWRKARPWIFGEFCDSDTLRDLKEVRQGKGKKALPWESGDKARNPVSGLKPDFYLTRHDQRMVEHGLRDNWERLRALSLDHSLTHRKVTLELTRSFPEICGYNITSIRDVPIATSGLLDDLGQAKFNPEVFRRFNGDAVLLQAWDLTRTWVGADRVLPAERYNFPGGSLYSVRILLSNYTGGDLSGCQMRYCLTGKGETLQEGRMDSLPPLPHAQVSEVARLSLPLPVVTQPATLLLRVWLTRDGAFVAENEFPVFVYPPVELDARLTVYDPAGTLKGLTRRSRLALARSAADFPDPAAQAVLVSGVLDGDVLRHGKAGGKLVLLAPGGGGLPALQLPMWREGMLWPDEQHPILDGIRKECPYEDLRYYSMTADTAMDSQALPALGATAITPVIRRVDCRQWTLADYLCTFRLGAGRCAATTLRLGGGLGKTPAYAAQNPFAATLLNAMAAYLLKS